MLVCERCGCSGKLGMGWLSVVRLDVEEAKDASLLVEYCPPCAEVVFGRPRCLKHRAPRVRSTSRTGNRAGMRPENEKAARVHEDAAATHDRAADLHEESANLHEEHAVEMTGQPERVQRAQRIADKERGAAARERALADKQRNAAQAEEE
jgi:hypothetical protein